MGIDPVPIVIPVFGGIAVLTISRVIHIRRTRILIQEESVRRQTVLSENAELRSVQDILFGSRGDGETAIAGVGSFSAEQLAYLLQAYSATGSGTSVAHSALAELNDHNVQMAMSLIPPEFHDRIVRVNAPRFPDGFYGAHISEVNAVDERWQVDVNAGVQEWLRRLKRHDRPGLLLMFLSPGGHAALGKPIVEGFARQYPDAPAYCVTILDDSDFVRSRFPEIRSYYADDFRGMFILDNLRNPKRNDLGTSVAFPGLTSGIWMTKRGLGTGNALARLFPTDVPPPRFATMSIWAEMLPVYHFPVFHDRLGASYYTNPDQFEVAAMRGIKAVVEQEDLQALPLQKAPGGRTRVCCVLAPVKPEAFAKSISRIEESLEPWRLRTDHNLAIQFASIGAPLTAESTQAPLIVVLLQPLAAGADEIDGLALHTLPIDAKFLPDTNDAHGTTPKLTTTESKEV